MGEMVDRLKPASGFSPLWYVVVLGILLFLVGTIYAGARYGVSLQTRALSATNEQELKELLKNTWASRDSQVLAAIAKNPHASPSVLREVKYYSGRQPTSAPSIGWHPPRTMPQDATRAMPSVPLPTTTTPTVRQPSASSSDITSRMPRQPSDR